MDEASNQESPRSTFWKELLKLVLLALVIVVPFRYYIAQPFIVDGLSMYPTFNNGQYLIIDEVTYHFETPERGSVLIFKYPLDKCEPLPKYLANLVLRREVSQCRYFIKRVIGLPGETISLKDGEVTIINAEYPDGFILSEPYVELEKPDSVDYILGEKEYFVMGDNRAQSSDSRVWGPVPEEDIVGRPMLRFIPPSLFPGRVAYETEQINNNP